MTVALAELAVAVAAVGEIVLAEGDDVGLAAEAMGGREDVAPVDQRPAARVVDPALRPDHAASKQTVGKE